MTTVYVILRQGATAHLSSKTRKKRKKFFATEKFFSQINEEEAISPPTKITLLSKAYGTLDQLHVAWCLVKKGSSRGIVPLQGPEQRPIQLFSLFFYCFFL